MRTVILLLLICGMLCGSLSAQVDTTSNVNQRAWMGAQPTDGLMAHQLPPPANLVNAGYFLYDGGTCDRDKWIVMLCGAVVGGALYTENATVGGVVFGGALAFGIHLDLRSSRFQRNAGRMLMSGYQIDELYELTPDSLDALRPQRLVPKSWNAPRP